MPWTAWFTRGVNLSGLWGAYGIFPIENHLFSRPLISLAEELRAAHGDLPFEAILPPETLEPLGLEGRVLSDLWKPADFMRARAWVKVAKLKQPYRREVLENLRVVTERDIAAIVERVRTGATFYITPEGDFSRDGRMHPMRGGIVEALAPFADLWLCAIAYDPFRGGRLSMLYRVLRYDGAADIGTSLAGGSADHDLGAPGRVSTRGLRRRSRPRMQCARFASGSTRCPGTSSSTPNCSARRTLQSSTHLRRCESAVR